MRYTKALIVSRFLIRQVEVTFVNGKSKKGRIILNNDPAAYQAPSKAKFLLLPLTDNEIGIAFSPSHVRKIEFCDPYPRIDLLEELKTIA